MRRRSSIAIAVAVSWFAGLATGAPTLADPASDDGPASASSELQAQYPLHQPSRCCSNLAQQGVAAVKPGRPRPEAGGGGWSPALLAAIAVIVGLALALAVHGMRSAARSGAMPVATEHRRAHPWLGARFWRDPWEPRPRHVVSPAVIRLTRPLFRYSYGRDAYVLRMIGNHFGPVLRRREPDPRDYWPL
ncbi:MAG: hypothetical protein GEU88_15990 [Solirubrobacterales bacterium]|nr:hypothetical protein [Solirubrobacterales bacterium]